MHVMTDQALEHDEEICLRERFGCSWAVDLAAPILTRPQVPRSVNAPRRRLCCNPAVPGFGRKILSMPIVAAMHMALVAHLHCFGIVSPPSVVMELSFWEPAATALAPSRLFDGGRKTASIPNKWAIPGSMARPTAFRAMSSAVFRLEKDLIGNVSKSE